MFDASARRELGAALAAAFLAGARTESAMVRRGAEALVPRPRWLPAVVRDVLAAYHRPPADRPRELAAYVALLLARRRTTAQRPRVRRWYAPEPAMGRTRWPVPPIASTGELAERLELDPGHLEWLADERGLERTVAARRLRHYSYVWQPRAGAPPRPIARPKLKLKAPTSPALASLAANGLDRRLTALAPALCATYSRYADDLTFSGAADMPSGTLRRVATQIAREERFHIASGKTSVRRRHERQLVCGVVVNERTNVPRDVFDHLKATLHDAARHGPAAANRQGVPDFRAHLQGRVAWVAQLHPARARRLQAALDAIAW